MMSEIFLYCLIVGVVFVTARKKCSEALEKSEFTGKCDQKWSKLREILKPTQPEVGHAWVKNKVEKDFTTENDAAKAMEDPTPAVIGPTADGKRAFYIVDDHHTLSALDYSLFHDVHVTLDISYDLRDKSIEEFWLFLAKNNLAFLGASPDGKSNTLPTKIYFDNIPKHFSFVEGQISLPDNPWRSLAGYSRKVKYAPYPAPYCDSEQDDFKYCSRCMLRTPSDKFFFEFRWGYYFLDATYHAIHRNQEYWPSENEKNAFEHLWKHISDLPISKADTEAWKLAANLIIPLCRSEKAEHYHFLPVELFGKETLPGYVKGYQKINCKDDDADCKL